MPADRHRRLLREFSSQVPYRFAYRLYEVQGSDLLLQPANALEVVEARGLEAASERGEYDLIKATIDGNRKTDEVISQLMVKPYEPDEVERRLLTEDGISPDNLFLLNPKNVWRHTDTRSQYQRWPSVRMKSIFELLDLKHQLRAMDRAHLLGGSGLHPDQGVMTPDGIRAAGALRIDDDVLDATGRTVKVRHTTTTDVAPMVAVCLSDDTIVRCRPGQPWRVHTRRGHDHVLTAGELGRTAAADHKPGRKRQYRHRLAMVQPVDLPERDLPLDPYLVGTLLGDGSLTQSIPKITTAEALDDQPWRAVLPAGVTVSQYEHRDGFCPQYGLKGSRWHHNEVTEGLRELGLMNLGCAEKFIPHRYLWAGHAQRVALLQGLLDTDGHAPGAGGGGIEYSTVSPQLTAGIVVLAQNLGLVAKTYIKDGKDNRRPCYRTWISWPYSTPPFRLQRRCRSWRPRRSSLHRRISSVSPSMDSRSVLITTTGDGVMAQGAVGLPGA